MHLPSRPLIIGLAALALIATGCAGHSSSTTTTTPAAAQAATTPPAAAVPVSDKPSATSIADGQGAGCDLLSDSQVAPVLGAINRIQPEEHGCLWLHGDDASLELGIIRTADFHAQVWEYPKMAESPCPGLTGIVSG